MLKNILFFVGFHLFIQVGFAQNQVLKRKGIVVLISANAEWKVVKQVYPTEKYEKSPWGEFFFKHMKGVSPEKNILFFHGGWGKVAASGSTQYVIDKFNPQYLINLGTCGGFAGDIERFSVILVDRTIIYDIEEAMGDSKEAINDYTTELDLSWLKGEFPVKVIKTLMVSADKDIIASEIPNLKKKYHAIAGDWETGGIAYVAKKNHTKLLILRGVSDLVSEKNGGEAYGKEEVFIQGTEVVMKKLLNELPLWLEKCI